MTKKNKTSFRIIISLFGILILAIILNLILGNSIPDSFLVVYSNIIYHLIIATMACLCFFVPIVVTIVTFLFTGGISLLSYFTYSFSDLPVSEQIIFYITPFCILLFAIQPLVKKFFNKPIITYYLIFVIYLVVQIILNYNNYTNLLNAIFNLFNLTTFIIAIMLPAILFFTNNWYKMSPNKSSKIEV